MDFLTGSPFAYGSSADENGRVEVVSSSVTSSCIASLCFFTLFINVWVCFKVYRKRSLRNSCTALMVANLALVDILISIKDLPYLLSVAVSSKWYFNTEWCRSHGLPNVVYIVLSVSTIISVVTDRFVSRQDQSGNSCARASLKIPLLGFVIAQSTLSYSLVLLWSKYIFISRKAFCRVEELSSYSFSVGIVISILFLIPIATMLFPIFGSTIGKEDQDCEQNGNKEDCESIESAVEAEESRFHAYLQGALGVFLLSWSSYVIDTFMPSSTSPSLSGIISAFIPLMTTSLIPAFFLLVHKPQKVKNVTTCSKVAETIYLHA